MRGSKSLKPYSDNSDGFRNGKMIKPNSLRNIMPELSAKDYLGSLKLINL